MTYAYDDWVLLPTKDLYDTLTMAMAINTAKDMYDRGQQAIKDFNMTYGDFITPIEKDQDWYNENVTGRVRNFINEAYSKGIDLTKSQEGRSALYSLINGINIGAVAKIKKSAEVAEQFLTAKRQLEQQGLYDKELSKYDHPDMSTYSTLDDGIWGMTSPTRITDITTFSNPYFEGMKPNIHKASKNGIDYNIESITYDDLMNIANGNFDALVNTPLGRLMYQYYRDQAGGNNNENSGEIAKQMFISNIVDSQKRRIYQKDDYNDNWAERQRISQGWANNALQKEKFELEKLKFEFEKQMYEDSNQEDQNEDIAVGTADVLMLNQMKQYNLNQQTEDEIIIAEEPGEQKEVITLNNANKKFQRDNVGFSLYDYLREDIDRALGLVEDNEGLVGTVSKDTDFSPVTELEFVTKNRYYHPHSIVTKLNKLIKDKNYYVSNELVSGRKYGAGSKDGNSYIFIQQDAEFRDKQIKKYLDKYHPDLLKKYGIHETEDGNYRFSITTKIKKGDTAYIGINTNTIKRNKSVLKEHTREVAKNIKK